MQDDTGAALTDDTLARRAGNGDREAFTALVTRHQASVFRLARVLTSSRDAAEDVLQQTFLSAWQHLGRFRGEASVRTWLLTIARHAALARRAQAHHERVDPTPLDELGLRAGWGGPSPEQAAMSGERAAALARAWAKLDADAQEVLTLRELEEMSGEETAALLGISLAAMKSRLHRARMALAAAVTEVTSHAAR